MRAVVAGFFRMPLVLLASRRLGTVPWAHVGGLLERSAGLGVDDVGLPEKPAALRREFADSEAVSGGLVRGSSYRIP